MVEELYIYDKNGIRRSVDLNTPSGITLKWVSNMFNSLDKVNCSYSYTFKIPMTRHNREVFNFAEDIRHTSGLLGKKLKSEFVQNGIPLFKNANLYIDKSTADSYSCVFTWDVIEGLQKLKDESCSLNELRDALIKAGYESDELTDGIVDWYVNWLRIDDKLNLFYNTSKMLYPYFGSYPSDPNYSEYPKFENIQEGSGQGIPKPTIPVRYIIDCINKAFGTTFQLGKYKSGKDDLPSTPISKWLFIEDNIINYGVLPLTGKDLTDKQLESLSKTLKFKKRGTGFWGLGVLGTYGIFLFEKNEDYQVPFYAYEDKINYLFYKVYQDDGSLMDWEFPSSLQDLGKYASNSMSDISDPHYGCVGISARFGCTIKMEGSFYLDVSWWFDYLTQETYDKLKLKVFSWKTVHQGYTDEYIEKIEVASFEPTSIEKIKDGALKSIRVYYNFNKSDGYEPATFCSEESALNGTEEQEYWFGYGSDLSDITNVTFLTELKFTPKINEMDEVPHKIDTFTNLPDIDCLAFMKSLFYIEGGFPTINNQGMIVIKKYVEIKENVSKGFVYDWSKKIIRDGHEETVFSAGDFRQNNYYMSKWDDLDRTEAELKEEDDVYQDGIGNIKCNNNTLDKEHTIHQTPFYPPFILNRDNPVETDHTVKGINFSPSSNSYSVDDRGNIINKNKAKYVELKPAYGYVHRIPFYDKTKTNRIKTWEENYGVDYIRMSVLNPFKDIVMNPSYRYLQEIVKLPFVITEKLLLNEFDLIDLDYTRPVYLEKYNSYFGIISIQRDSKGVCKCELIKLPTYQSPVKVTLSFESQLAKFLHYKVSSTSKEDKTIMIGFIIENSVQGQYVQHSKVNLKGDSFQIFNPTSNTNWVIKDVWLDHYEEGDYNDYEFQIG